MANYIEISGFENVSEELWREGGDSQYFGSFTRYWGR